MFNNINFYVFNISFCCIFYKICFFKKLCLSILFHLSFLWLIIQSLSSGYGYLKMIFSFNLIIYSWRVIAVMIFITCIIFKELFIHQDASFLLNTQSMTIMHHLYSLELIINLHHQKEFPFFLLQLDISQFIFLNAQLAIHSALLIWYTWTCINT